MAIKKENKSIFITLKPSEIELLEGIMKHYNYKTYTRAVRYLINNYLIGKIFNEQKQAKK